MECSFDTMHEDEAADPSRKVIKHSPYLPCNKLASQWFELRVFYVRVSNCEVDGLTPEQLTVNHIPLSPDTLLEVNGGRCSMHSDGASSLLRRDRVDKKSEEATFVSTDSIRMTGSVKFEVYDNEDIVLSGVLEMSNANGFTGELKNHSKRWSMDCKSEMTVGLGFLKGKQYAGPELPSPMIEVYIAGCFAGNPIILTKTLQLSYRKKHARKGMLHSIPEGGTAESHKEVPSELDLQQVSEYHGYKPENGEDYNLMYTRGEYLEVEDGELSWFNAGVRVGVGIGLGICLGVGVGVGLLVRTYQATTKTFKRRLV
ncbi:Erythronate-4-phosphate dehydrogenase family protein [Thalictrum thalictroides]|uniref:Erythronate-4-phosphate dehydrogenase family protein n=1 Tax=Thalictrum thalictroides TaxID=46969 RepID=A0A7J6V3Z4_THATH|nr:Erythronate-4-phosphate dehydrogenase family protein [Thalictrum thalictroides]